MCDCGLDHSLRLTRRRFVAAAAALATGMAAGPVTAFADCFDPAALAGEPGERVAHRAAAAVTEPPPARPGSPVTGPLAGVIRRVDVPAGHAPIALTFDLCQTRGSIAGYDGAIVSYLQAQSVPATFF